MASELEANMGRVWTIVILTVQNRQGKIFAPTITPTRSFFEKFALIGCFSIQFFAVLLSLGKMHLFPLIS
jgi:hypothetical protein